MPQHLGIDVEKNISTETEKRLLSQSHSHVFRENVNIIGVHLRYVVVQLVQGIQQRSQVCLEDHQTSEENHLFGPWDHGVGKMPKRERENDRNAWWLTYHCG